MRLIIGQLSHECNSFNTIKKEIEDARGVLYGSDILKFNKGKRTCIGGFIDLAGKMGVELIPTITVSFSPGGIAASSFRPAQHRPFPESAGQREATDVDARHEPEFLPRGTGKGSPIAIGCRNRRRFDLQHRHQPARKSRVQLTRVPLDYPAWDPEGR